MKVTEVQGTITLADGSTREFRIGTGGVWSQWGADRNALGASVEAVDAMVQGLLAEELLASESDEDDDEQG